MLNFAQSCRKELTRAKTSYPLRGMETIQIELTTDDVDLLINALEAWEHSPNYTRIIGGIMGALLAPKEDDPKYVSFKKNQKKMDDETYLEIKNRKVKSLMLRARLAEAGMRASEFRKLP